MKKELTKEVTKVKKKDNRVQYLIRMIDFLMDSKDKNDMVNRMNLCVENKEFIDIIDGLETKPKFLINFARGKGEEIHY
jgi:hypothetical protein